MFNLLKEEFKKVNDLLVAISSVGKLPVHIRFTDTVTDVVAFVIGTVRSVGSRGNVSETVPKTRISEQNY